MSLKIFPREVLPILVLEMVVDLPNALGRRLHSCVIAGMINVKILGAQQFFKDVLVFLENVIHQPVGLAHKSPFRSVVTAPKSLIVLENREHFGVPKKLTKEPQLADRCVGNTRRELESLNRFINDVILVSLLQ